MVEISIIHILSPGINDVLVWDNYTTVSDLQREHTITNNIKVTYSFRYLEPNSKFDDRLFLWNSRQFDIYS